MNLYFVLVCVIFSAVILHYANAQVWIADNEFSGYFDSNGVYTVFGAVKNTEQYPIISTVQINIQDNDKIISSSYTLPTVFPSKDMPFKFKFPQVTSKDPVLETPIITYQSTVREPLDIEVIYDKTLVKHSDGHISGFIVNDGNSSQYNVKIYALIHSKDNKFIDEAESVEKIVKMDPGQKEQFSMYPDPKLASKISYYSCFVPGADYVVGMSVPKGNQKFDFSVLSLVYFSDQKFDDKKNTLYFDGANAWPLTYSATFMFPNGSGTRNLQAYVDDKPVYTLVSKDNDTGNWHVAFNVDHGQHKILISGFNDQYNPSSEGVFEYSVLGTDSAVKAWGGYSGYTLTDSQLLNLLGIHGTFIPPWMKNTIKYVIYDNLPSNDVVKALKYLNEKGIVR